MGFTDLCIFLFFVLIIVVKILILISIIILILILFLICFTIFFVLQKCFESFIKLMPWIIFIICNQLIPVIDVIYLLVFGYDFKSLLTEIKLLVCILDILFEFVKIVNFKWIIFQLSFYITLGKIKNDNIIDIRTSTQCYI